MLFVLLVVAPVLVLLLVLLHQHGHGYKAEPAIEQLV
ncbi:hypothetical protein PF005_g19774 [Phytophthora fragariae]|uniref:RxLR effector protein n=1 Tax=Phytophthora fragariae TaxID=53985 RepID=A0A6A3XK09_9STRA|nr:hypothetical protein PF003_g38524 [Phytophthora fragariae]KAE8928937.1 hypothetical protein PF009_g20938 [Phytophthora fragariae]KAE8988975.1 hypothetical protein PF011_g18962 [Phytophthora fragariae]KAE9086028.1 hypothetical protein PF010_g20244 [Phytophthora fragariae]KAE9088321.1 hypothetical protein PF007_g20017 [Phytophthora fragariae]